MSEKQISNHSPNSENLALQHCIKLQLGNIFQKKQIFLGIFENILQSIFVLDIFSLVDRKYKKIIPLKRIIFQKFYKYKSSIQEIT